MRCSTAARDVSVVACLLFLATVFAPHSVRAQGLSGSEVSGTVRLADGRGAENAVVILVDRDVGARRITRTGPGGAYRFDNVDVGSYRLEARSIGSAAASTDSVELHIGDRLRIDIQLGAHVTVLDDAVIKAQLLRDPGAGGAAVTIAGRAARNIPLINRDVAGLFVLTSKALGPQGLWITGQHSRYNGIQIDGAAANDFFGVSVTPGSASGSRLVSPEVIEEVRILIAPFDVRLGGFAGGLINAVTRSGTNQRTYSTFATLTRSELIGNDTSGARGNEFSQLQYGMTASGPLIRDHLHYFAGVEIQQRAATLNGLSASDPKTGISEATALRIQNVVRAKYGFDPGGPSTPDIESPTVNTFLKISWHPRPNVAIDFTPSYATSSRDTLSRGSNPLEGWQLSRSGSATFSKAAGAVVKATFTTGPVMNETILGYASNRFGNRSKISSAPQFLVQADVPTIYAGAGSTRGAQGTSTFESVGQLAHNASLHAGNHTLIAGTQDFVVKVRDNLLNSRWGIWTFLSVDSLEAGRASRYEVALPARRDEPSAAYTALIASLYVQDHWQVTQLFRLTAGLRGDAGFLPSPRRNEALLANDTLGNIDTSRIPSGNWSFSPRIGFAWTVGSNARSMIRGGIGYFTARPPYAWTTGAYAQTGETQSTLTCTPVEGVPEVSVDIDNPPTACSRPGGRSAPTPAVTYFSRDFRLPQSVKGALGFDTELGNRWTASIDVTAARTRNQLYVNDENLRPVSTSNEGRVMYGTIGRNVQPSRLSKSYLGVYRFSNYTHDRSISASAEIRKEWNPDQLIDIGYTWTRTLDVMGLLGFNGGVFLRNNPLEGTLISRELTRSARDIPHNFVAMAIFPVGGGWTSGLFFRARSGTPWAFTISGDANADGAIANDFAYIPRDSADVSLANPAAYHALNDLIESLPCMRAQRGRLMSRNSCRNHSVSMLDGRITKTFNRRGVRRVEVSADVFNIANLVNRRWGIVRETSDREFIALMSLSGWDAAHNRPLYSISIPANGVPILPSIDKALVDASRWRVQLGARYEF